MKMLELRAFEPWKAEQKGEALSTKLPRTNPNNFLCTLLLGALFEGKLFMIDDLLAEVYEPATHSWYEWKKSPTK